MNTTTKIKVFAIGLILMSFTTIHAENLSYNSDNRYTYELNKLNAFLEDFEDGYFGYMEVIDEYVYIRFQEGNFSKFRIEDMANPVLDTKWGQVNWDCKNESLCVETDWNEDGKESGILFQEMGGSSLDYLMDLLNNFISAYNNK